MTEFISSFLIEPIVRQARRFSSSRVSLGSLGDDAAATNSTTSANTTATTTNNANRLLLLPRRGRSSSINDILPQSHDHSAVLEEEEDPSSLLPSSSLSPSSVEAALDAPRASSRSIRNQRRRATTSGPAASADISTLHERTRASDPSTLDPSNSSSISSNNSSNNSSSDNVHFGSTAGVVPEDHQQHQHQQPSNQQHHQHQHQQPRVRAETDPQPRRDQELGGSIIRQQLFRTANASFPTSINEAGVHYTGLAADLSQSPGSFAVRSRDGGAGSMDLDSQGAASPPPPQRQLSVPDGPLPEDDGMGQVRQRILAIQRTDASVDEKSRLIHSVMMEQYNSNNTSQQSSLGVGQHRRQQSPGSLRASSPGQNSLRSAADRPFTPTSGSEAHSTQDGGLSQAASPLTSRSSVGDDGYLSVADLKPTYWVPGSGQQQSHGAGSTGRNTANTSQQASRRASMSLDDDDERPLGCMHYKRNVKLQCSACSRWYTCRFCHDDAEDHQLNRRGTRNMLCMLCGTAQPAAGSCRQCGEVSACYYCDICKLWNNDAAKNIYHCDGCGICRIGQGLGKDFYHCKTCCVCLAIAKRDTHRCIERSTDCDCPICGEYMFTSPQTVVFMRCGHSIHQACYRAHMKRSYKCPICSKSVVNMEMMFNELSMAIEAQPMPPQFRDTKAHIYCNDCTSKSSVAYHWLGLKCNVCESYNTIQLQIVSSILSPAPNNDPSSTDDQSSSTSASLSTDNDPPSSATATNSTTAPLPAPPSPLNNTNLNPNPIPEPLRAAIQTALRDEQQQQQQQNQASQQGSRTIDLDSPPEPAPSQAHRPPAATATSALDVLRAPLLDVWPDLFGTRGGGSLETGAELEGGTAGPDLNSAAEQDTYLGGLARARGMFGIGAIGMGAEDVERDDDAMETDDDDDDSLDFWGGESPRQASILKRRMIVDGLGNGVGDGTGSEPGEGSSEEDDDEESDEDVNMEDDDDDEEEDVLDLIGHR